MSMAIETISSKEMQAQLMGNDVINILTREYMDNIPLRSTGSFTSRVFSGKTLVSGYR